MSYFYGVKSDHNEVMLIHSDGPSPLFYTSIFTTVVISTGRKTFKEKKKSNTGEAKTKY